MAAVMADPKAAARPIDLPGCGIDGGWGRLVYNDVVEDQIVRGIELGQPMPVRAAVRGFIDPAAGSAEVEMVRMAGNRCKGSRIPTVRPDHSPGGLGRQTDRGNSEHEKGDHARETGAPIA